MRSRRYVSITGHTAVVFFFLVKRQMLHAQAKVKSCAKSKHSSDTQHPPTNQTSFKGRTEKKENIIKTKKTNPHLHKSHGANYKKLQGEARHTHDDNGGASPFHGSKIGINTIRQTDQTVRRCPPRLGHGEQRLVQSIVIGLGATQDAPRSGSELPVAGTGSGGPFVDIDWCLTACAE